ncbi:ABC transporter ATP-binding protein [Chloracidobacterium aggregatum]|uniref:ABC transporter ATP-binding protein n=1 Tax=Chloracidobacterium sp. N TaxID=2821540 RepID=A0ABX8AYK2_9BACT|nr:ABC transporter ATP-binding protein [Chloracidobacterium aggregatum]QUV83856.1 ABC transporter ATP-binding protein [Chloracidobacterium sp. 2]QUV87663.1 ABC transporter ATP-binding protein [Chloracidobacterium sp. S]QUV90562.1 ABC transporter ATP-binding protein [Chloracidobacterium sp. A]QUV93775.1 ABC transporter ATP-binding protein [Chloracidobacterium sp. N]QUV96964.1 ABC transporter ATP-binding protein [Chloracidobacterium sp. E]
MALLVVEGLRTHFPTRAGVVPAVDDVSLTIERGETLALVGESGSGKSVTALSIMGLVSPPGRIVAGRISFAGRELRTPAEAAALRGSHMAMIFQDPMTSLNPVFTVGEQIAEALRRHKGLSSRQAWQQAVEALASVAIPDPARRARQYPHEVSGGMRQRVMIAMALSCNPQLLIADEPTTALDVTIQAQILELIAVQQRERNLGVLLITHDLGVVAQVAHRAAVMYAGRIVETAPVEILFSRPQHPYTQGLLASVPRLGRQEARLPTIEGVVPKLTALPPGCAFAPRCPEARPECRQGELALKVLDAQQGHAVRCVRR